MRASNSDVAALICLECNVHLSAIPVAACSGTVDSKTIHSGGGVNWTPNRQLILTVALLRVAGELPSVILTDWGMPKGMGGGSFLEAVKRDPALTGIPVVVVSGTAEKSALKLGGSYE